MIANLSNGIWIGFAAAVIGVFASIGALYLWAVSRTREKLDETVDPQSRAVIPWLAPLLLPAFVILCLGLVKALWKAYDEKSWPEASTVVFTAWPFMILYFWLKKHKKT